MSFLDIENTTYEDIMDETEQTIQMGYWKRLLALIWSGVVLAVPVGLGAVAYGHAWAILTAGMVVVILAILIKFYMARVLNAQDQKFQELEERIQELQQRT